MNKKLLLIGGIVIAAAIAAVVVVPIIIPQQVVKNTKLGIIVNTPTSKVTLETLKQVYQQASFTGAARTNLYLFWNNIEPEPGQYNWKDSDILMSFNKNNGMKTSLYFSIINGRLVGPYPQWMGIPGFGSNLQQKTVQVLDAILSRYDGQIDYLIIGGNLDSYFGDAEGSVSLYKEFFNNVYTELKQKHPGIKIGNAFSLNNVLTKNLQHYVSDVGSTGDFVAFTYMPVDRLNEITKTPTEARQDLEESLNLVPDKPVAFFEVSWSTSEDIKGTERDQAEFLREAYDFYRQNQSKIEFFNWFRQFDRPQGSCKIEQQFEKSKIEIGGDQYVRERLGNYLCSAGLIKTDGSTKPAWEEFKKQIQSS